jgi:hypothetical protein
MLCCIVPLITGHAEAGGPCGGLSAATPSQHYRLKLRTAARGRGRRVMLSVAAMLLPAGNAVQQLPSAGSGPSGPPNEITLSSG